MGTTRIVIEWVQVALLWTALFSARSGSSPLVQWLKTGYASGGFLASVRDLVSRRWSSPPGTIGARKGWTIDRVSELVRAGPRMY